MQVYGRESNFGIKLLSLRKVVLITGLHACLQGDNVLLSLTQLRAQPGLYRRHLWLLHREILYNKHKSYTGHDLAWKQAVTILVASCVRLCRTGKKKLEITIQKFGVGMKSITYIQQGLIKLIKSNDCFQHYQPRTFEW